MRRAPDSLHHMKKSRSDSNLNISVTGSVNGDSRTASRPRSPSALSVQSTPNRPVHDRLYQEANHSQTRLDRLRERVEQQRESSIWSSSFIETSGLRSPSANRTPRGRAESPSSSTGRGKRRSLSGGHSTSKSLAKTTEGSDIPPNEYLYYCQQQWAKDKDASVVKLAKRLDAERDEALQKELTLRPQLSTAPAMQMQRGGQSPNQIFHALHNTSFYYADKKLQLKQQREDEFKERYSFIPQITPNSKRLAKRRQLELSGGGSADERTAYSSFSPNKSSEVDRDSPHSPGNTLIERLTADPTNVEPLDTDRDSSATAARSDHVAPLVLSDLEVATPGPLPSDWNPFDENSKHYSIATTPSSLLTRTNTYLHSTTTPSSQQQQQQQQHNPHHHPPGSYRAVKDSGGLRIASDIGSPSPISKVVDGPHPYRGPAVYSRPGMTNMDTRKHVPSQKQQATRSSRLSVDQLASSLASRERRTSSSHANKGRSSASLVGMTATRYGGEATRGGGEATLFDRLYEARNDSARELDHARSRHTPRFSHTPNIGSSSVRPVEKTRDAFFGRLYDQFGERQEASIAKQQTEELRRQEAIASSSFVRSRAGRTGNPRLTSNQTASHVNRLLESKQRVAIKVESAKNQLDNQIDQQQHSRFIRDKSDSLASKAHVQALNEIFSVLLVTMLLHESAPESTSQAGQQPTSETKSASADESESLNVSAAQPAMLQPKLLAECIGAVLAGHQESFMTREQFVSTVQRRMRDGSLPPMGYLLTQPGRANKPVSQQRAASLKSSEQLQLQECRAIPVLTAQKTTNKMVKERYQLRNSGLQSVEDSLLSYRDFQESSRIERKVEREKENKRDCTFAPNTQSPYMTVIHKASTTSVTGGGSVNSQSSTARSKRSNSAPPRASRNTHQTHPAQTDSLYRKMKGIQEGAIYPLENGVVFVKPLLFLPAEEISSLTAGRGGGAGNTRYVDLKIETVDDKVHEFTNIEREELAALQMYVKGYLEARSSREQQTAGSRGRQQQQSSSSGAGDMEVVDLQGEGEERQGHSGGATAVAVGDDDSDESEDDDYSPGGSDDSSNASDSDNSGCDSSGSDSDSSSASEGRGRGKKSQSKKASKRGSGSGGEGETATAATEKKNTKAQPPS
eukprot:gene24683-31053_t